ncbi:MAG: hypothetical protein Q8T09_09865 [Candidatus Melainabacteria bacterium]|nr:hypothetical protein [Candidatus Melainabacteria bacterium]
MSPYRHATLTTSLKGLIVSLLACLSLASNAAWAQSPIPGGAPRPGRYTNEESLAPGQDSPNSNNNQPTTFNSDNSGISHSGPQTKTSRYRQLPLTAADAKQKLDELRAALGVSRPQDVQDGIYELVEWLQDAADAHYRMATAFTKADAKREAASERQLTSRFGQLKREALLLKADLLIKQKRAPEALTPLVDIVIADPKGTTGVAAYHRLQDLGFSQELPSDIANNPTIQAASASPAKPGSK